LDGEEEGEKRGCVVLVFGWFFFFVGSVRDHNDFEGLPLSTTKETQ
jgi:ammonia channel protein AmtB